MKSLLERMFIHVVNGDEDKAAALIHKIMIEKARKLHETLRAHDNIDELDEDWDSEIHEEEYFGDGDFADDDVDDDASDTAVTDVDDGAVGDDAVDDVNAVDAPDAEDNFDDLETQDDDLESGEGNLEGKLDDLTDKIDELTAEFDRVMAKFDDGDDDADGDFDAEDNTDAPDDFSDDNAGFAGDVDDDMTDTSDDADLADRMDDDFTDEDDDDQPDEDAMAESKLHEDDESDTGEDDMGDDDLTDITESVLAELEKVAAPGNTENRGVGSNSAKSNISDGSKTSPVTHHNVMDREKGARPIETKGRVSHTGYARETAPTVADPNTLVTKVRKENRRSSFKDGMAPVPKDGDSSAMINKDYAARPATKGVLAGKSVKA